MNTIIVNFSDTYEHRADLLFHYFQEQYPEDLTQVVEGNFRHREKTYRDDAKENYIFLPTKAYHKNLSFQRLLSHHRLAKDIFSYIQKLEQDKNRTIDLIWVFVPANSLVKQAAAFKKNHPNVKIIFDIIDLWPESLPIPIKSSTFPLNIWKNRRDKYIDIADSLVLECELYRSNFQRAVGNGRIRTIYLAKEYTSTEQPFHYPDDCISLCYLGSVNNIIDIPAICSILRGFLKHRPVDFHIIGDGEKNEELCRVAGETGANVIHHGKIYHNDKKQEILTGCHYGLNIMKKDVRVGLTMKSVDYFKAGLPVLNNIKGDTWDFVKEQNLGYNIHAWGSECNGLQNVSFSDATLAGMQKNVRSFCKNTLSIERFEQNVSDVIDNIFVQAKCNELTIILVIYNRACADSESLQSIAAFPTAIPVLVYDNSTKEYGNRSYCEKHGYTYLGGDGNKGISVAYNQAIRHLKEQDYHGYVMLFDDDTHIPPDYPSVVSDYLEKQGDVYLPLVKSSEKILSPCRLGSFGTVKALTDSSQLASIREGTLPYSAINSGMVIAMSVFHLYQYDETIFLDGIDHEFMAYATQHKLDVTLMNYEILHEFSEEHLPDKDTALTRFRIFAKDSRYIFKFHKLSYLVTVGKRAMRLALTYRTTSFLHILLRKHWRG